MFPDSKRVQPPRRLPRQLSIKPHNRGEENRLRSEPKQRGREAGKERCRRYLRLKVQSRAVFNSHALTSNQNVDPSFSTLQALHEKPAVWDWKATLNVNTSVYCGSLLVKHSYILSCIFKLSLTVVVWKRNISENLIPPEIQKNFSLRFS